MTSKRRKLDELEEAMEPEEEEMVNADDDEELQVLSIEWNVPSSYWTALGHTKITFGVPRGMSMEDAVLMMADVGYDVVKKLNEEFGDLAVDLYGGNKGSGKSNAKGGGGKFNKPLDYDDYKKVASWVDNPVEVIKEMAEELDMEVSRIKQGSEDSLDLFAAIEEKYGGRRPRRRKGRR